MIPAFSRAAGPVSESTPRIASESSNTWASESLFPSKAVASDRRPCSNPFSRTVLRTSSMLRPTSLSAFLPISVGLISLVKIPRSAVADRSAGMPWRDIAAIAPATSPNSTPTVSANGSTVASDRARVRGSSLPSRIAAVSWSVALFASMLPSR